MMKKAAALLLPFIFSFLLSYSPLSVHSYSIDEGEYLFEGINKYRQSLNLTSLTNNDNAHCLAGEIADQLKDQPCTNSTGANTVPGTEPQFSNYPTLLTKCHLNISNTRAGSIMPACVPDLDSSTVLSNFTKSLYSGNLNDSKYTGMGIGFEDSWIVVVLTTNTSEGSFVPATDDNGANSISSKNGWIYSSILLLVGNILLY